MSTSKTVRRFDRASVTKVVRTDEGYLRAPARLTRAGVFEYRNDGKTWRELRLPEEVFAADSLKSFELLPLVSEHPTENQGAVDAKNVKRLSVGSVGRVSQDTEDSNFVSAEILVTDADAVRRVENGTRELSCGYFCEREPAPPGSTYLDPVTGDSTPYDFVQRNIRGNHVAIVRQGRAGPEAKIMLDAFDGIETNPTVDTVDTKGNKVKINLDGVTFEVDESVGQAFAKLEAASKAFVDRLSARADSAESQVKELTAKLADASDAKKFEAAVASRLSLVSEAVKHAVKCDGLSDLEVRRAIVAKIDAAINLDGKSDEYVNAAFDLAVARNPVQAQVAALPASTPAPAAGDHRAKYVAGFFHRK